MFRVPVHARLQVLLHLDKRCCIRSFVLMYLALAYLTCNVLKVVLGKLR